MKIISWNINGIRAIIKKNFYDFLENEDPDVLCLQETKINDLAREKENFNFNQYQEYWFSAQKPGYSGVLTLIKNNIKIKGSQINGLGKEKFDIEGRTQSFDFGKFYLVNNYFPNANRELSRLDYKIQYNKELFRYLKILEQDKPVIVCGDFNVAHQEIDLARPKDNIGKAGFTNEEREWMSYFLKNGFVDVFRYKYPYKVQYTWWSYRTRARLRNIGWRIDYFCVSEKIISKIKKIKIKDNILGSDHCPILIEI